MKTINLDDWPITVWAWKDGELDVALIASEKRALFDAGALPLITFKNAEEMARVMDPITTLVSDRLYLTELYDKTIGDVPTLISIKQKLEAERDKA